MLNPMDDVNSVDTRALQWERVQTVEQVQDLQPFLAHNQHLMEYVNKQFREPSTLIMRWGRSCIVASILEHDFFGRTCLIAWGQNPERGPLREAMDMVDDWARLKGATTVCAFIGEEGPWQRLKAFSRLTKLAPFRMVMAKELL